MSSAFWWQELEATNTTDKVGYTVAAWEQVLWRGSMRVDAVEGSSMGAGAVGGGSMIAGAMPV